jgi:predicted kinase
VVDNTNATRAERAELVGLGKEYGAEVMCYYFPPDLNKNLERNRLRSGKARVPDVALFATRKRFEIPEWGEGFDRLYVVKIVEGGGFAIETVMDPGLKARACREPECFL